ncbi:MAG TPA: hypothetical protein VMR18_00355 [Candidatus Saccharimonadales bacterium]|nr:hypothetical protein [Candidatus Saccharimonadales bacterium]
MAGSELSNHSPEQNNTTSDEYLPRGLLYRTMVYTLVMEYFAAAFSNEVAAIGGVVIAATGFTLATIDMAIDARRNHH